MNECWNLSKAVVHFTMCSQLFLFSLLSWFIVGREYFTSTLILGLSMWLALNNGIWSTVVVCQVQSPKHHMFLLTPLVFPPLPSERHALGSCWSQMEKHMEETWIHPVAWSISIPANPQTGEWEQRKYLTLKATEILGVFVTHYFHPSNSWLKQSPFCHLYI